MISVNDFLLSLDSSSALSNLMSARVLHVEG